MSRPATETINSRNSVGSSRSPQRLSKKHLKSTATFHSLAQPPFVTRFSWQSPPWRQSMSFHYRNQLLSGLIVRLSLVSVLGVLMISIVTCFWMLPGMVENDGGGAVQRYALGILPLNQQHSFHPTVRIRSEAGPRHSQPDEFSRIARPAALKPLEIPEAEEINSGVQINTLHQSPASATTDSMTDVATGNARSPYFPYRSLDEMNGRAQRFPSVDDRTKVYMSNWYLPPCNTERDDLIEYRYTNDPLHSKNASGIPSRQSLLFREARTQKEKIRGTLRLFHVDDSFSFDEVHYLNLDNLKECNNSYCPDMLKYLVPAARRVGSGESVAPMFFQFSDAEKTRAYSPSKGKYAGNPNVPSFKKFRLALSNEERRAAVEGDCAKSPRKIPMTILQQQELAANSGANIVPTAQPLIFKLKMQRHYGYVKEIPSQDIPWSEKKSKAIFRGQFTGRFPSNVDGKTLPAFDQCQLLHRCRLVYNSDATSIVDAKLALPVLDVRKDFPMAINGVDLYGERVSVEDMLSYKAIIMLEGNDVSSGLKWALYSNSIVMTQTPTKTSWAMEELLEPWKHYIPLSDDLSDVEDKMQWVIDNDEEAQAIAHAGMLWISDLVFHSDADADELMIFDEMVRRSAVHFRHNPSLGVAPTVIEG